MKDETWGQSTNHKQELLMRTSSNKVVKRFFTKIQPLESAEDLTGSAPFEPHTPGSTTSAGGHHRHNSSGVFNLAAAGGLSSSSSSGGVGGGLGGLGPQPPGGKLGGTIGLPRPHAASIASSSSSAVSSNAALASSGP